MKIKAIVQTVNTVTAYTEDGAQHTFPVGSPQGDKLISFIPKMGSGTIDFDLHPEEIPTYNTLEELMGIFSKLTGIKSITLSKEGVKEEDSSRKSIGVKIGDGIISGVERLRDMIEHALDYGITDNMKYFLERLENVRKDRDYTVKEIIDFLEKADLPLDKKGNILAYKKVYRAEEGLYVDCHSQRVSQRVGSIVQMANVDMVNPDRRIECSNGLHVCRRSYLRGFSGDVCLLISVAPEDIVAVPEGDTSKVRVSKYTILTELPQECFDLVERDLPISRCPTGREILTKAVNGELLVQRKGPCEVVTILDNCQTTKIESLDPRIPARSPDAVKYNPEEDYEDSDDYDDDDYSEENEDEEYEENEEVEDDAEPCEEEREEKEKVKRKKTKTVKAIGDNEVDYADKKEALREARFQAHPYIFVRELTQIPAKVLTNKDCSYALAISRRGKMSLEKLGFSQAQIKVIKKYAIKQRSTGS